MTMFAWLEALLAARAPVLSDAAIKGAAVLGAAGLVVLCLRRASAAPRLTVWLLTLDPVPWGAPLVLALAPLSFLALMAGSDRARAVRRALVVLTLYLAMFAASTPALG